jgi:phage baseplate assembly protein gpV
MSWDQVRQDLAQMVRIEVERVMRLQLQPRLATVVDYDPKKHRARVALEPEGVETNWIAADSGWVGKNWGFFAPLGIGQQVKVVFPQYGANEGIIVSRVADDRYPPPSASQQGQDGELYVVDKQGSSLAFTKDGKLTINGHTEIDFSGPTIKITATTEVDVTAPLVKVSNGGTAQFVKLADGSNSTVLKAQ